MPLTLAEFVDRFPEFADAPPGLVQAKLDEADRRTPPRVWGVAPARDAQGYLAAHLLAISPFGRDARLVSDDGATTYGTERARMELELAPAVAPRTT